MPLIVTPGQLAKRAELYQQLGQLTAAGVGVLAALEMLRRKPPAAAFRPPLQLVLTALGNGQTFTNAMRTPPGWLPEFDLALLQAGEHTGRLDASCRQLAAYYFDRARLARTMISQLLYPAGLVHLAVFVFVVVLPWAAGGLNFDASLALLFVKAGLVLLPLYTGTALLLYLLQSRHGEAWRATVEAVLYPLPVLGTARHQLALARLAAALEALVSAGVNIVEAWQLAAEACGSPALRRIVAGWPAELAQGHTPAQIISGTPRFPEMFANLYTSGEVSGKLDESLRNLARYYQEEGTRRLQLLATLVPKAIYLAVMLIIAWQIIQFYSNYFNQINEATKGF
jgi:type II secretory pathway component PulF